MWNFFLCRKFIYTENMLISNWRITFDMYVFSVVQKMQLVWTYSVAFNRKGQKSFSANSSPMQGWPVSDCSGADPRMEFPQPLWLLQYLVTLRFEKSVSAVPTCVHCLLTFHYVPLSLALLSLHPSIRYSSPWTLKKKKSQNRNISMKSKALNTLSLE